MKKLLSLVLVMSFVLTLCACTVSPETTSPTGSLTPEVSATPTPEDTSSDAATPTTTPTPTDAPPSTTEAPPTEPKEFYEYNSNYILSTERNLNVLPVGKYKITFSSGEVLSYEGTTLSTGGINNEFSIHFQNSGNDKSGAYYMITPGDSLDSAFAVSGSNLRIADLAYRNNSQLWSLKDHGDGTYSIISKTSSTRVLALSKESGKLELKNINSKDHDTRVKLELVSEGCKVWDQYISQGENIIIRVKKNIYNTAMISKQRIAKLANDMQTLYETYQDLTGFTPYESIVIQIFQEEKYFAYVVGGWNIISFNYNNAMEDLKKMSFRETKENANDWSFCLMHEMGHMFDLNRGWRFDGESATNIKVAYALWANLDKKAVAAQSGYGYKNYFDGNTISETWKSETPIRLGDGKTLGEKVTRTCYIFSTYALNEIGWEAFRKSYREINALDKQPTDVNERLKLFTDTLAKHGGKHIKEYIGETEWNALVEKCAGKK